MLMKSILALFISFLSLTSFAHYSGEKSVEENKKSFNLLVSSICGTKSINLIEDEIQLNLALKSFPKELALLYLNNFENKNCYKSFSFLIKYLVFDYKLEVERILSRTITSCIKDSQDSVLCNSLVKSHSILDLSLILGQVCTKNSLEVFRSLNCYYKKSQQRYCSLYQGLIKDSNKCPNYHLNQREVKELHQLYFNPSCPLKGWKKLKC